jgi:hypothetical protein
VGASQEWELSLQQDLGHNWIAEVDYEGNHGVHQPVSLPINQINPPAGCCFAVADAQSLRPYPQFLTISNLTNGGASEYAALLATLTRSWSNASPSAQPRPTLTRWTMSMPPHAPMRRRCRMSITSTPNGARR